MSEVVENLIEQNCAQSKVAAVPTETVEDVTTNNVGATVKAVPEAVEAVSSATSENAHDIGLKQSLEKSSTSPKEDNKKTPTKRTPSKRMSFIERAQKESEELVKNMGGSLEIEGGRRTRSSTRGTPTRPAAASTPPAAKKARTSPASGTSTPTKQRGRGRKIDITDETAEEEETKPASSKKRTPGKGKKVAAKDDAGDEAEGKVLEAAKELENNSKEEKEEEQLDAAGSNIVADKSKENPISGEETKEATDDMGKKLHKDETDVSSLETVVEETSSQITAEKSVTKQPENSNTPLEIVSEIHDSVKNNSAMETEDAKPVERITEEIEDKHGAATTVVEELQKVNEPIPEPMEVDSSSKSSDALEKMEDDVVEIIEETNAAEESIKTIEHQQSLEEITPNLEEIIKENSVIPSAAGNPPTDIVTNNSKTSSAAVIDVANINENNTEETASAANDLNKTENDLCEPKIATSPTISTANDNITVTTPQKCN